VALLFARLGGAPRVGWTCDQLKSINHCRLRSCMLCAGTPARLPALFPVRIARVKSASSPRQLWSIFPATCFCVAPRLVRHTVHEGSAALVRPSVACSPPAEGRGSPEGSVCAVGYRLRKADGRPAANTSCGGDFWSHSAGSPLCGWSIAILLRVEGFLPVDDLARGNQGID
jgi:hypothetical protein